MNKLVEFPYHLSGLNVNGSSEFLMANTII